MEYRKQNQFHHDEQIPQKMVLVWKIQLPMAHGVFGLNKYKLKNYPFMKIYFERLPPDLFCQCWGGGVGSIACQPLNPGWRSGRDIQTSVLWKQSSLI